MLPVVVQYNVSSANATNALSALQHSTSGALTLSSTTIGPNQQRVTVTSQGNDSTIYFHIVGLNQAGFTVTEYLAGGNGTGAAGSAVTVQSNLDYQAVISITPSASSVAQVLATTAGTVSAGLNGVGSSLWNIVNWHETPSNISYATILQSGVATWSIQYTYDDPNNLPIGVAYPQAFNHPTIVNASATIDGNSNDPLTAWRLLVTAGTGTVRAIGIQAGISGP